MDSDDPSADEASLDCPVCRICFDSDEYDSRLIKPCDCRGSVALVHPSCLEKWVETSKQLVCQVCRFAYEQESVGLKKISEWTWPRLSPGKPKWKFFIYMAICMIYMFVPVFGFLLLGFSGTDEWMNTNYLYFYGLRFLNGILYYHENVMCLAKKWYKENIFYEFKDKCTEKERRNLDRMERQLYKCLYCPGGGIVSRVIKPCRCYIMHARCLETRVGKFEGFCPGCNLIIEQEDAKLRRISEWKFPRPMSDWLWHKCEYLFTIFISFYKLRLIIIWITSGAREVLNTVSSDSFWLFFITSVVTAGAFGYDMQVVVENWYNENRKYTFKDRSAVPEKNDGMSMKSERNAGNDDI